MTGVAHQDPNRHEAVAQADGPTSSAVKLPAHEVVPAHLLNGGEVVHFAIKPSPWFVLIVSLRWLALAAVIAVLSGMDVVPYAYRWYFYQLAAVVAGARLAWGILEWVSRLYVLTDRRVMRLRGVFNVELFECGLDRLQNTYASFSVPERITRVGTITFQTAAAGGAGPGGTASWRVISRPLEIHEKLRQAIRRTRNRGNNGL